MQPPDCDNWDDQNHEITHNIDSASADDYGVLIDAILSPCNFVGFADALGYYCEDEGDRIEKVPVEDKPDANQGISISLFLSFCAKGVIKDVDLCRKNGPYSRKYASLAT